MAIDEFIQSQINRRRQNEGISKVKLKKPGSLSLPRTLENRYNSVLQKGVDRIEQDFKEMVVPQIESIVAEAGLTSQRTDAWPSSLGRFIDAMKDRWNNDIWKPVSREMDGIFADVDKLHDRQFQRSLNIALGVPVFVRERFTNSIIESAVQENVALVTNLTQDTSKELSRLIQGGVRQGKRAETITKEILEGQTGLRKGVFHKVKSRAKLIARDQVTKFYGDVNKLRQTNAGIEQYVWRTALDERVRDSHRVMNGRICRWDNPNVYYNTGSKRWVSRSGIDGITLHPGQDVQCRCYGEPRLENIVEDFIPI